MKITKKEIKEGLRKCAWFDETKFTYEPDMPDFIVGVRRMQKCWWFTFEKFGIAYAHNIYGAVHHLGKFKTEKQFIDAIYKFIKEQL